MARKPSHTVDGRALTIGSLLRIHPRFLRSVHLERDIEDPSSSLGYILTQTSSQAIERISESFRAGSSQRAWRLAGDYGSGKTDLALALARVAAGDAQTLPPALKKFIKKTHLQPRLATGATEPLGTTVLRALGIKSDTPHPTMTEVLAAVQKSVKAAQSRGKDGIVLILDELGKNLEYAARNTDTEDIFLLQRLGEEASRSGDQTFVIVVIVHQGIMSYANGLDSVSKAEWSKISGRYEEVNFVHPIEQTAVLLHATLGTQTSQLPNQLRDESIVAMKDALELGLYGSSGEISLAGMAPGLFPLHPTTIPVLLALVRRFGQNERSLFSFVSSAEPLGLQYHARQSMASARHYRISNLFDYVQQNLASSIHGTSSHTRWGIVEAIVTSTSMKSVAEEAVLKTVGLLNLIDSPDFAATTKFIQLSAVCRDNIGPSRKEVTEAIASLQSRGVLYERGISAGLCLWPHTSVDIEQAFERGFAAASQTAGTVEALCASITMEPLVPRGYYVETGTLRYASVNAAPASDVLTTLNTIPAVDGKAGDLKVHILVPIDERQMREARSILQANLSKIPPGILLAIVEPPTQAVAALQDKVAWEWVSERTPALAGDRYAREEVSRRVAAAEHRFQGKLASIFGLAVNGGGKVQFYFEKGYETVKTGRDLLAFLGDHCRAIYGDSPKVKNELINRRSPSAAAVSARTKLAEAMATAPHQMLLGMDATLRPPEMALYLSVLQKGNLHCKTESGWEFRLPSKSKDDLNLRPSIERITQLLKAGEIDARIPVPQLFDALRLPPYGIRDGLIPFVLAIYLAVHHQRVALYEDGSYLHQVGGDHFQRLMKEPQAFSLQYCGLDGVRATVLPQLLEFLKFAPRDPQAHDLLDLVRPLAVFIAREIPEYARRTNILSATAIAVRKALLEAREPVKLVFTLLPIACGMPPITTESQWDATQAKEFADRLGTALHELRNAYGVLLERVGLSISKAFDGTGSLMQDRPNIIGRAAQLSKQITEPSLKAFTIRLADSALSDRGWIESISNLLGKKSPERWADIDESEFYHQIELLSGRFRRVEAALFQGAKVKLNGHACRIALTRTDGTEVNDLVRWDDLSETTLTNVEKELSDLISRNGRQGLAAAMKVLWNRLSDEAGEPQR